jgi:hypothetical protein
MISIGSMVAVYRFDCQKCNYSARACGGEVMGRGFLARTIICLDCREIYDVVSALTRPCQGLPSELIGGNDRRPVVVPPSQLAVIADQLNLLTTVLPAARKLVLYRESAVPFANLMTPHSVKIRLLCPVNSQHRIRLWKESTTCPRCHDILVRSPIPYRIWD